MTGDVNDIRRDCWTFGRSFVLVDPADCLGVIRCLLSGHEGEGKGEVGVNVR